VFPRDTEGHEQTVRAPSDRAVCVGRSPRRRARASSSAGCARPGSQLALVAIYDYHAFVTDREGTTLYLEATTDAMPSSRT